MYKNMAKKRFKIKRKRGRPLIDRGIGQRLKHAI